jgi:hypothetical protein
MSHTTEVYSYLFSDLHWSELPILASPLSLVAFPLTLIHREALLLKLGLNLESAKALVAREDILCADQLQLLFLLAGIMPTSIRPWQLSAGTKDLLAKDEYLGRVGSKVIAGRNIAKVVGIQKYQKPVGLLWIAEGNVKQKVIPSRLAQAV